MTGKLKILSLSKDMKGLKEKKIYEDVVIHFRDLYNHTITLKNKKGFIVSIQAVSIEADSLLLEADIAKEDTYTGESFSKGSRSPVRKKNHSMAELRFWPCNKELTSKQG